MVADIQKPAYDQLDQGTDDGPDDKYQDGTGIAGIDRLDQMHNDQQAVDSHTVYGADGTVQKAAVYDLAMTDGVVNDFDHPSPEGIK